MSYGLPQRCALIVLAMRGGDSANNAFGFTLEAKARNALEADGLITVDRRRSPMTLRLTERGWRAFEDETVAEPPPGAGSAGAALYPALHTLGRLVTRGGGTMREVLREVAPTPIEPAAVKKPRKSPATGKSVRAKVKAVEPARAEEDDVESVVRAAYRSLAGRPRDWVELTDLRAALAEVPREDLDSALMRMVDARAIEMTTHEDRGKLTKAQRDAALRVGRSDMHLVSIDG